MSDKELAVTVRDLYKSFKLPHEQSGGVKQAAMGIFSRSKGYETQKVLSDVSFDIKKGEFFGIVGRNGSGKSTLLKLLAGIYAPDKGFVQVNGSLTPFIELGVGFNPELTGRENLYLNGALLGFDRGQMDEMYDEIVGFAELEKFMDQKLKNYSSGMQVRLAFSIAIRAKSDILLIDEVLAVGDAAFQQKCYETFFELKRQGVTIILVTHDMGAVLKFCDRALLISKGRITSTGTPFDISEEYLEQNYNADKDTVDNPIKSQVNENAPHLEGAKMHRDGDIKVAEAYEPGDTAVIEIDIKGGDESVGLGIQLFNSDGVYCFGTNTYVDGYKLKKGIKRVAFKVKLDLLPGNYTVNAATMDKGATSVISYHSKICKFRIKKTTEVEGVASLEHAWE